MAMHPYRTCRNNQMRAPLLTTLHLEELKVQSVDVQTVANNSRCSRTNKVVQGYNCYYPSVMRTSPMQSCDLTSKPVKLKWTIELTEDTYKCDGNDYK
eukprot:4872356-Amphidinium_carterae.1